MLSREEARALMDSILELDASAAESHLQLAALLGALAARGETEDELAGFVDGLRARATPIPLTEEERTWLVDTCGTGGDLSGTFNISTAAALVAAAAGAWVAKHGNRAVTSSCGSADVLEALGIPVNHTPASAAAALRAHRFAFLPAPALQPAMRTVQPIRRALGVRTMFNLLGPMTNPAGARAQVIGVYAAHLVPLVARTLAKLNTRHAFVVHGAGMDEISISQPTTVAEVKGEEVGFLTITPHTFGLDAAPIEELAGADARTNAAILRGVFAGEKGARRDVVVANAAAVLITAGIADNFMAGARLAESVLDHGQVADLVDQLGNDAARSPLER